MKSHILFSQEAAVWFKEMRGGRRSRVKWRCLATFIFYSFFSNGSCIHLWLVNMQLTGAQNDGFFLNTLKTLLRLSRVLLDLWKCILSGAKKLYLFGHPRRTWVFSKLQGLQYYFPDNFRSATQRFTKVRIFLTPLTIKFSNSKILGFLFCKKK